jgi:hypothetical protein
MSDGEVETTRAAREAAVRVPERRQITMVVQCPGDLVPAQDPVRMVMALVETLDLSRFAEPIKARDGVTGRDATAPQLLVGCGCARIFAGSVRRGLRIRASLSDAVKFCEISRSL